MDVAIRAASFGPDMHQIGRGGEGIGPIPKGRAGDLLLKERRGPTPNAPPPTRPIGPPTH